MMAAPSLGRPGGAALLFSVALVSSCVGPFRAGPVQPRCEALGPFAPDTVLVEVDVPPFHFADCSPYLIEVSPDGVGFPEVPGWEPSGDLARDLRTVRAAYDAGASSDGCGILVPSPDLPARELGAVLSAMHEAGFYNALIGVKTTQPDRCPDLGVVYQRSVLWIPVRTPAFEEVPAIREALFSATDRTWGVAAADLARHHRRVRCPEECACRCDESGARTRAPRPGP